jgi:hypothetical protein
VLHSEFAASLGPDRLRREITTAARLQHRGVWPSVAAGAVVLVLAAGALAYMRGQRPAGPTMLAVLPFETDGDTSDAWITYGITDEVRGRLAAVSGSVVSGAVPPG